MNTVFSEFNHEYIKPDADTIHTEGNVTTCTGYGMTSGRVYRLVFVDGVYDDYKSNVSRA